MALIPAPLVIDSLNELLPILRGRGFWVGLVALGLILGVAGPYGTAGTVPILPRMGYWLTIVLTTGTIGFVIGYVGRDVLDALGVPGLLAGPLAGAIAGLPVSGIVIAITAILLNPGDLALSDGPLILSVITVSVLISAATTIVYFLGPPAGNSSRGTSGSPPRLLDRLPQELQGPLISLSAINHYTEVVTIHGTTRLLLRLSDAIIEAAPTPGLRLHRSHWVALDRIASARRDGHRGIVTLTDGSTRPVSRRSLHLLEEMGYL